MFYLKKINSPIGEITLIADEKSLVQVHHRFNEKDTDFKNGANHPVIKETEKQLKLYFAGKLKSFDVPVTFAEGTAFQKKVWQALKKIPYGKTITYGDQARAINSPAAVRAVGAANGKNPLPIIVPCHRVIGASGALTGFGWGIDVKKYLLELEGVKVSGPSKI